MSNFQIFRGETILEIQPVVNVAAIELCEISEKLGISLNSRAFAEHMDSVDPLSKFRDKFNIPVYKGKEVLYFVGNSLGLQPKKAYDYIIEECEKWKQRGVRGHFETDKPWFNYEDFAVSKFAKLVGAKESEVALMNTLTANLHLLMVPFYRPTEKKFKILIEENPFPSDMYAILSQIKFHGLKVEDTLIMVGPRKGEDIIHTQDILDLIETHGESISVVMLSGVQFLTGQAFEMEKIVKLGHSKGCIVGFDCAHAGGNLDLQLHDWNVDFACFCTYKYMNSGPGSIAALFVHEMHKDIGPKFEGWWGNKRSNRFAMKSEFDGQNGAASFQLSNPSIFSMAPVIASLEIFEEAGIKNLRTKSKLLTSYLELMIENRLNKHVRVITPKDINQRGCQISIKATKSILELYNQLEELGVDCDKRDPDVLRISPVPLYNRFVDVYDLIKILETLF